MADKFAKFMKVACIILFIAIGITALFVYFTRNKSMFIDANIKSITYDVNVGDKFEFTAVDKPSVGINHEEPKFDSKFVKYLGKTVDNQSNMTPGITGGDKYVNTYRFEAIAEGETEIILPKNYRGEITENSAEFKINVQK
jgi:hypothetical protein